MNETEHQAMADQTIARLRHIPQDLSEEDEPLNVGSPCPAGCMVGYPGREEPERLTANVDGELSCPTCWDMFGFVVAGEVIR